MILADCGTSYTKILDLSDGELAIIETSDVIRNEKRTFHAATGHLGRLRSQIYKNELVCLALGTLELTGDENFCVVDIGGRDTKLVEYRNGRPYRLDWSMACGANTGFTLEIIGRYYKVDYSILEPVDEYVEVTCGVFGIERVFDAIINGIPGENAVARFVHGIARNVYRITEKKDRFYLSGGLTENSCFMNSISKYAEVIPLGRAVLLEGLKIAVQNRENLNLNSLVSN
jgi:activator of 2-hydroxyglutaryl-CoA dehydratase